MTDKTPQFIEPEAGDAPLFSEKEIAEIKAKAKAEIIAAKKDALRKDMIAAEKHRLQVEEGLTTGNSHMDEIVNITIDLENNTTTVTYVKLMILEEMESSGN